MIEVSHSVVIDRPVDEVFDYAGDPVNDPAWASVIIASELTSVGPLAKGSTLRQVATDLANLKDLLEAGTTTGLSDVDAPTLEGHQARSGMELP